MGTREQAADRDFSGIPLDEEVEASLKETAVISMGTEISEMDLENIVALCDQVFSSDYPSINCIAPSTAGLQRLRGSFDLLQLPSLQRDVLLDSVGGVLQHQSRKGGMLQEFNT